MSIWLWVLVVIMVHEAGHALAGVLCGTAVRGVCVGVGPLLYQYARGRLVLRLRLLPLGVATIMERSRTAWQVRLVALAGPATGVLLAILAAWLDLSALGVLAIALNVANLLTPLPGGDGWRAIAAGGFHRASVRSEA